MSVVGPETIGLSQDRMIVHAIRQKIGILALGILEAKGSNAWQ